MPIIDQKEVLNVLRNHYFDHHTAMHLSRERIEVYDPDRVGAHGKLDPGITKVSPLLDPSHKCDDCQRMMLAGEPGSGRELLSMHHDMIRVFDYLLDQKGIHFGVKWEPGDKAAKPSRGRWVRHCASYPCYAPEALWDLDDPKKLPYEIRALFSQSDPNYLEEVFNGVSARVENPRGDDPVDELGIFIERGVTSGPPDGRGFHNTIHEYLGSREGRSAAGAEMNKLRKSLFNDYFWSLHLWIDGQYGRLLENLGETFETGREAPEEPMASMQMATHARVKATGRTAPVAT